MVLRNALPAVLVAALLAGCAGPGSTATGPAPSADIAGGASAEGSGSTASRPDSPPLNSPSPGSPPPATPAPTMPAGFPVHPSMVEETPEPRFIASWTSDALPSDVYDYYLAELVAAGFVIDVEGPGGEAAILRFHAPDGTPFQLNLLGYVGRPVEVHLGPPHP